MYVCAKEKSKRNLLSRTHLLYSYHLLFELSFVLTVLVKLDLPLMSDFGKVFQGYHGFPKNLMSINQQFFYTISILENIMVNDLDSNNLFKEKFFIMICLLCWCLSLCLTYL